ncbi:hypothetical protein [Paenibacillus amylolyticus]|uniref:hypothetical protein n=1 Tax=Paenibacillus amylolyticus TaxID=1451 RepID=UPI003397724C
MILHDKIFRRSSILALVFMILCSTLYIPNRAVADDYLDFEGKTISLRLNTSMYGWRYDLLVNGVVKKTIGDGVGDIENPTMYTEESSIIDPQLGVGVTSLVIKYSYYTGNSRTDITQTYKLSDILGNSFTSPEITPSVTVPTNTDLVIAVKYPSNSAIRRISIDNGQNYQDYTGPLTITSNRNIIAVAASADGTKVTATYSIKNIDKTPPVKPTLTPNITDYTNSDVTIKVNYESNNDINEYRIDYSTWLKYTGPIVVDKNSIIEARSTDLAGNVSLTGWYQVFNIDKTPPKPAGIIVKGKTDEGYLDVTINPPIDATKIQYSFDHINWNLYSSPLNVTTDTWVYVRVFDRANNVTESSVYINAFSYALQMQEAIMAVIQVETSLDQKDFLKAKGLVAGLNSTDQTDLVSRLDVVQSRMEQAVADYAIKLAEAKELVNHTEAVQTQESVDRARLMVDQLQQVDQIELIERLGMVQNYIDTLKEYDLLLTKVNEALRKVEETLLQYDLDAALVLIAELSEEDQSTFLIAADTLQELISANAAYTTKLSKATLAVEVAETTVTQVTIDNARSLISELKEQDKDLLSSRLDVVQGVIDAAEQYAHQLDLAVKSVETAEQRLLQEDVHHARGLVGGLKSEDQVDLNSRLDVVQGILDDKGQYAQQLDLAIKSVEKAEHSLLQEDVDYARELIDDLKSEDQVDLNSRLERIQEIIDEEPTESEEVIQARAAVELAETSFRDSDVLAASSLVSALADSELKTALLNRIQSIKQFLEYHKATELARKAVELVEATQLQNDLEDAKLLVQNLSDGAYKEHLSKRLEDAQQLISSLDGLSKEINEIKLLLNIADGSKKQADLNKAKTRINVLPASAIKNDLMYQMALIQVQINPTTALTNATLAVTKAESYKNVEFYGLALAHLNALPGSDKRDALEVRLEAVKLKMEVAKEEGGDVWYATLLVERTEETQTLVNYNAALNTVSNLKTSSEKSALSKRLKAIESILIQSSLVIQRFEVSSKTKDAITLSWDAVPGANGYKLERIINNAVEKTYTLSTQTKYKDAGLALNTGYTYKLTPKSGSVFGQPKVLTATTAEVSIPQQPTLLVGEVDEDGMLHVSGSVSDELKLYYVLFNEKGVRLVRTLLKDSEEKTYGFTKEGIYTLQLEAYNTSERISSFTNPVKIEVKTYMVEPPTPVDVQFEEIVTEDGYVTFKASVANNVDGKIEKYQFELSNSDGKRLNYSAGKLVGERIEYSYRRSIASTPAGEYTVVVKGKRGTTYSDPVSKQYVIEN